MSREFANDGEMRGLARDSFLRRNRKALSNLPDDCSIADFEAAEADEIGDVRLDRLRAQFCAAALTGILSNSAIGAYADPSDTAKVCMLFADEIIENYFK